MESKPPSLLKWHQDQKYDFRRSRVKGPLRLSGQLRKFVDFVNSWK